MVVGFVGLAVIVGSVLYIKYRIFCRNEGWRATYRICRSEVVNTRLPLSRVKPIQWDYAQGIPRWNTAYIMASGFDPRYYTPHPGDSDALP